MNRQNLFSDAWDGENEEDGTRHRIFWRPDDARMGATLYELAPDAPEMRMHVHFGAEEMFFVLSGSMRILLDDQVVTLGQGDFLTVPPTVPHAFAPAPGSEAEMLVVFTPGMDRFDYYRLLDRVHRGEATWQDVGETQDLYDNHYVDSPVWTGRRTGRCAAPADGHPRPDSGPSRTRP